MTAPLPLHPGRPSASRIANWIAARIAPRLRRFATDQTGSYAIECVLILPILFWVGIATLTYVDAYRMQTMNLRATYAIGDVLSRQWEPVDKEFIDGLARTHAFLTNGRYETKLRVTVASWREKKKKHRLVWSDSSDNAPAPLNQRRLRRDLSPHIPVMANGDSTIIVETWMEYVPPFAIGLSETTYYNRTITSPRFVPQLKYES